MFLKKIQLILIATISVILVLTTYFIVDAYFFNPSQKGISPVDIKNVLIFSILPLAIMLFVIRLIGNKVKK